MSPGVRIGAIVAATAVAAAAAVVGITLATRQNPRQPQALPGKPGVPKMLVTPAAEQIRTAFRSWPKGSLNAMEELAREYPRDVVVQLYRGVALAWAGYNADAEAVLRRTKKLGRDSAYEIQADDLLHPEFFRGYPIFEPTDRDALLEQGSRLQQQGRQHSAERLYLRAARARPDDAEAQVAAAVGRFDKDNLSASFSRLGPLTRRFPRSQEVRFYLGLLLAWTGQGDSALVQFRRARALDPDSELGKQAQQFLASMEKVRTSPSAR